MITNHVTVFLLLACGILLVFWQLADTESISPSHFQNTIVQDSHVAADDNERFITASPEAKSENEFLEHSVKALDVMQSQFYELWLGIWPDAIDWTAAVVNTHVSATLGTLARFNDNKGSVRSSEVIHRYFSHSIAYYFGENAFAIRNEAYDDMLWVVLGWLESVKFINDRNLTDSEWHGTQFIPAFSHRARIFWDIASKGWDTSLCDGGMIWNPRLTPYKNAITNQLFISASVAMYLYFPGDKNSYPYLMGESLDDLEPVPGDAYDSKYLKAAVDGYDWLKNSNMLNSQGLYIDGFHVRGWGVNGTNGTGRCDERNEQVYTYNQGVILSGLRGLWQATGDMEYLKDGYELIKNVMLATGWSRRDIDGGWSGLGRNGILEEICDHSGSCGQDAQTFKGIFFQHLAQFCMPLPLQGNIPGKTQSASRGLAARHDSKCHVIGKWVSHNAKAALGSQDKEGRFGMWWGQDDRNRIYDFPLSPGSEDYRNNATILSLEPWVGPGFMSANEKNDSTMQLEASRSIRGAHHQKSSNSHESKVEKAVTTSDINDRGRGRTVETQTGGLAVVRAAWELTGVSRH